MRFCVKNFRGFVIGLKSLLCCCISLDLFIMVILILKGFLSVKAVWICSPICRLCSDEKQCIIDKQCKNIHKIIHSRTHLILCRHENCQFTFFCKEKMNSHADSSVGCCLMYFEMTIQSIMQMKFPPPYFILNICVYDLFVINKNSMM